MSDNAQVKKQKGALDKDTTAGTLLRAFLICLVCSVAVAGVVTMNRDVIKANKQADKQGSALSAAKVTVEGDAKISDVFNQVMVTKLLDLDAGKYLSDAEIEAAGISMATYNPLAVVEDANLGKPIPDDIDIARIDNRAKYMPVYLIKGGEYAGGMVLPVYGKGLWSTLYGFLALEKDGNTIISLQFYDQKETPGLGGRIGSDQKWLSTWEGQYVYDETGDVRIALVKAPSAAGSPATKYEIDSLSGATLTSDGVTNLLKYWLGPEGYGPFLKAVKSGTLSNINTNEEADRG